MNKQPLHLSYLIDRKEKKNTYKDSIILHYFLIVHHFCNYLVSITGTILDNMLFLVYYWQLVQIVLNLHLCLR